MRRTGMLLAFLVGLVLAAHARDAKAEVTVGIDRFYDDLAPYGDWFQMEDYGWVWTPRHVASDWRPYTRGRWVFSDDDGWMWASDEDFGWATGHYGRWFFDDRYGWIWVPGSEWAPAWVSWRWGGGYVGWAPLPPRFRWNESVGFRVGDVDFDSWIAPRQYVFVPERHFVDSGIYRQVVPPSRNVNILSVTRNVTNYGVRRNRPVNRSLSLDEVEGRVGHAVPRVRVVESEAVPPRRAEVSGGAVQVFRPTVKVDSAARPRFVRGADVPKVKPHPAEPPVDAKVARQPERPPTATPRPGPAPPQAPYASVKPAPTDAALRKEQLEQTQERQQQALRDRQARQEQQLRQKQQQQQEREASERRGQQQAELQRQQEEQRLKLQQEHERDHKALQDKQARQLQQLQEKQRKEQAQTEEARRKQQREEAKARPQPTSPPS